MAGHKLDNSSRYDRDDIDYSDTNETMTMKLMIKCYSEQITAEAAAGHLVLVAGRYGPVE